MSHECKKIRVLNLLKIIFSATKKKLFMLLNSPALRGLIQLVLKGEDKKSKNPDFVLGVKQQHPCSFYQTGGPRRHYL